MIAHCDHEVIQTLGTGDAPAKSASELDMGRQSYMEEHSNEALGRSAVARHNVSSTMGLRRSWSLFMPLARALVQLDDPIFVGVVARSVIWSVACFAALYALTISIIHRLLDLHGLLAWAVDILGSISASFLTLWLFLPVATAIGTLYFDRIAIAVERRHYPDLQAPRGAPLVEQLWDGITLGLQVLGLNAFALMLALMVPGVGLILGWMIAAFAVGRGLFVTVAMRRMPRAMAEALYRSRRGVVLAQGAVLALAAYIPILNLLIPMLGTAAMVHILDSALSTDDPTWGSTAGHVQRTARQFDIKTHQCG